MSKSWQLHVSSPYSFIKIELLSQETGTKTSDSQEDKDIFKLREKQIWQYLIQFTRAAYLSECQVSGTYSHSWLFSDCEEL